MDVCICDSDFITDKMMTNKQIVKIAVSTVQIAQYDRSGRIWVSTRIIKN